MASAKAEHLSLSEEGKDRRVIVENLPQGVADIEEKLVIYFQSRKHGGGDVESVSILDRKTAVVIFEDTEVLDNLLGKKHFLMDTELSVKPFGTYNEDTSKQVFRCVMAEIDPSAFSFDQNELKDRLRELQRELRFNYREVGGNFLLSGSLQQISTAHERLKDSEMHVKTQIKENERGGNRANSFTVPNKIARPAIAKSGEELAIETGEIGRKAQLSQEKLEGSKTVKTDKSTSIVPLVCKIKPEIMRFFIRLYKPKLEQIEKFFRVQIRCEGRQSTVAIFPSEENPPSTLQFNRACDEFTALHEEATRCTILEYISPLFDDEENSKRLRQVVGQIQKRKGILVERGLDRTKWILYGKIEEVAKAKEEISKITETGQDSNTGEGSQDTRRKATSSPALSPRMRGEMRELDISSKNSEMYLPASVEDRNRESTRTKEETGKETVQNIRPRNEVERRSGISSDRETANTQDANSQQTGIPLMNNGSIFESKRAPRKPSYTAKSDEKAAKTIANKSKLTATLGNHKKTDRYLDNGFAPRGSKKSEFQRETDSDTTNMCVVCLGPLSNPVTLQKCKHTFCKSCIETAFKVRKMCPYCKELYVTVDEGDQPRGEMTWRTDRHSLPGFSQCGRIIISYKFSGGVQGPEHYKPGEPYSGTTRCAYLPDNLEGWEVARLLRKAFEARLVFTIGYSLTTLQPNQIVWAGIEHKTNIDGGIGNFGYPDAEYLQRVTDQLASMGIY